MRQTIPSTDNWLSIHRTKSWVVVGNMVLRLRILRNLSVTALLAVAMTGVAFAQGPEGGPPPGEMDGGGRGRDRGGFGGGRGGFGGFGGGRGGFGGFGVTGELRNDSTMQELGLTDEQKQKLEELNQARREARGANPKMQELFGRMRDASDEERQFLQAEIQIEMSKAQAEAEEQVKQVIGDEKLARLRQISYHRMGVNAVTQDSVAKEIGLSQDQKDQIAKLQEDQMNAFRTLGFQSTPEDRQKVMDEFKTKITAVLTPEQQGKWQGMIGPPPADMAGAAPGGGPAPGAAPAPRQRTRIIVEAPPGVTPELSFGTEAKATQKLKFGFRYAPWMDVLKLFADSANLSLDLNAVPPGTFSYYDKKEYTPTEALDILNGYLLPKGFVLVRRDDFLVCISIDEEIAPNLVPVIGAEELATHGKNELLTVVFPLEGVDVTQIAKEIDQVKGPQGKVVGMQTTNSLMVTDIGTNLRRIQTLLAGATRGGLNDLVFKPYTMKFLAAADAELILRGLLGLTTGVTNVSAGGGFDSRGREPRFGGFGGFGGPQPAPAPAPTPSRTAGGKSFAHLTADPRTNSLLVSATAAEHTLIAEALQTIDVDSTGTSIGSNRPYHKVYRVTTADPREVTKTIDAIMPGIVVNEDGQNRSISIMGTEKQQAEVEALIRQLDGGSGAYEVVVIPLSKMDALTAVSTLQSMFIRDGNTAPTIQADSMGRQVMVRGSADQLAQVKTLLTQLGEDGTGRRKGGEGGMMRRYPISGRDTKELLPLIERMWGTASPNPIRIVTPDQRGQSESGGSIKGVIRPSQNARENKTENAIEPSAQRNSKGRSAGSRSNSIRVQTAVLAGEESAPDETDGNEMKPAEEPQMGEGVDLLEEFLRQNGEVGSPPQNDVTSAPASSQPDHGSKSPEVTASSDAPPVVITVLGDELLLTSDDPAALDQLEELLEQTMEVLPPRLQWTVFPLQTADATEVATTLEQLLPDSSVTKSSSSSGMLGSMGGGVSSFGSSLMGMTGLGNMAASPQTLQIIPEVRLNALWVAGPSSKVREVEELLKVLDASEWPDSLRDKSSHVVQLEYADAQDVYDVLKDVYKGYLEDASNNPQANALAMLMGGGRNRNEQNQKPKTQLAIGIDKRTNQIIVWGDDTLFREIESLAKSLDQSAQEAKRTVRVMSLQNTNSSVVTSALGQLMPKVKVSSSGPRTSSSSNSSSGSGTAPNNSSSGGNNTPQPPQMNQDQMREMFRQRMLQGGGGGPFGGSPFGGGNGGGGTPFGGGDRGFGGRGGRGGRGQ